jgi:preprotein translocase subunit SecB
MMSTKQKSKTNEKKQSVDVSTDEMHYAVQCADIRLISSSLNPVLTDGDTDNSSRFAFRIHAIVEGQTSYSYLEVQAGYPASSGFEEVNGYDLSFVLMGIFKSQDEKISPEDLGQFVKLYTLTILWPYAREYATDQLRRASIDDCILPIINPQIVTEHIITNNLVEVQIIKNEGEKA